MNMRMGRSVISRAILVLLFTFSIHSIASAVADLSISMTGSSGSIPVGGSQSYTITLNNAGSDPTAPTLDDSLPSGTTFISISPAGGWSCSTPAVGAWGTISCSAAGFPIGSAVFTLTVNFGPSLTAGSVVTNTATVSATDDPDPSNNTSSVATNIVMASTSITITSHSPDPSVAGSPVPVTYNVSVVAPGAGTPTGTVTVTDGVDTCTAPVATGTCNLTMTTVGGRLITASYSGDSNYGGSTSFPIPHLVVGPPGVTLINSVADTGDGQIAENEYTNVSITQLLVVFNKDMNADTPGDLNDALNPANYSLVQDASTVIPINGVIAYNAATHTATLDVNGGAALPKGRYALTVLGRIEDTLGVPIGTDFVRNFAVGLQSSTTLSLAPNPSLLGGPVVLTATVNAVPPATGTPTGTVEFLDGATSLGMATLAGGTAALTTSSLGLGSHLIVALYSGDTAFLNSGSSPVTQGVCLAMGITVANLNDSGPGSLRQAISDICPGGTIDFGITGTITLSTGLLLDKNMTIAGPGASGLTVSANGAFEDFDISGVTTDVKLQGLTVTNVTPAAGGGIMNLGVLTVSNSTISGTNAGIINMASLTAEDTSVTGNILGIMSTGELKMTRAAITANSVGVVSLTGTIEVNDSVLSDNVGDPAVSPGGGILNAFATLTISGSTFAGNGGAAQGGGILNVSGTATVSNCTFTGNSAAGDQDVSGGGAIFNGGVLAITNSTLSGNTASNGGGVYNTGTMTITNSILSANTGGNCLGTITDGGNNIEYGSSCGFSGSSRGNTDPLLDPAGLRDNGGPTQTIALLAGSPAINAGNNAACPATDQRGIPRPQGPNCDIGAYEFGTTTTTVTSSLNPSVYGQSVTFTATVSDSEAASSPTGTVTFRDGASVLGSGTLSGDPGTATLSISTLGAGSHSITAAYDGDGNFAASTSSPLTQVVNQASTTTSIISDTPDPSAIGQAVAVSYTITVLAPGSGTPTGNVTVSDGLDNCTGAVAAGSCSIILTTPGPRTLSATYSGDADFIGSSGTTSHTVLYQYRLNVTTTGSGTVIGSTIGIEGNGITCGTDCSETYNQGTVAALRARPEAGWLFDSWSGACGGSASCSVTMDAAKSVTATFRKDVSLPITGISSRAYDPLAQAIAHQLFEEAYPVGIGPYAAGKDSIAINTGLKAYSEPTDLYFLIRFPSTEPQEYYLLKEDYTFTRLSDGITPWKANWTGAIDENLFGIISSKDLTSGTYELYMMAAPTGRTDTYQIWETAFDIPFSDLMPLPSEGRLIVHQPGAFPARSTDPAMANPVGLGSVAVDAKAMGLSANASMGDSAELKIGLEGFDGPADIYFGIYLPDYEPNDMYILRQDGMVQRLSEGLAVWKPGHVGPVDEMYGPVSVSNLLKGRYVIYLLATPAGRLDTWYMWETEITIP